MDDDFDNVDDFDNETPGMAELGVSWDLFKGLRRLKLHEPEKARLWAIAATEAERLHAWIAYVVGVASDETVAE